MTIRVNGQWTGEKTRKIFYSRFESRSWSAIEGNKKTNNNENDGKFTNILQ